MVQQFSFQSMFRDVREADVKKMARRVVCCISGQPVKHTTWLAVVNIKGKLGICLPECVNGCRALVPYRELVETLVPDLSAMKLTVVHRYATVTQKRKRTNVAAEV
jgi:hypothetical protein